MKLSFARVTLGVTLVAALLTFAQVTQAHECAVSDAAGRYGCTSTGTIVNPPIGPFTAIGHVRFTETETLSGAQTTSIAGNLVDEILQGTFTVNPDCTGSATVYIYHGSTLARTSRISIVWNSH